MNLNARRAVSNLQDIRDLAESLADCENKTPKFIDWNAVATSCASAIMAVHEMERQMEKLEKESDGGES